MYRIGPARFQAGAQESTRRYRTGDLVRARPDGNIDFLGRTRRPGGGEPV
jgi:non-ribosomal peptide synthetase component F